jgi:cellulose synthase/poly-beta-1,6-N-acetylglucosamine synthase-like glycosyltransferase
VAPGGSAIPTEPVWPGISAVVPAYLEASLIGAKVADLRSNGYPGDLEVLIVADDAETAEAARATGVHVIAPDQRLGKAEALNLGIAAARQPVVVLSDANTTFNADALAALARHMSDPTVVAVAGEKRVSGEGGGQGWFWRFESWLKGRETLTGTTIGLVGELAAVRRSWVLTLPADLAVDDLWLALDVIERGGRIVYEPAAVATEEPSTSLAEEWERRTRVVAGTLDVVWRRRRLLRPEAGVVAAQLWGHRLVRSSFGPIAHLLLLLTALGRLKHSRLALTFVIGHLAAAVALARSAAGRHSSSGERLLAQVLFLQLVGLGGTLRYLRMDRPALWPKVPR